MSSDSIIDAYELRDVAVTPDSLLLDPKNPRIVLNINRPVDYTLPQVASDEIQTYILSVVDKSEFHVADLIDSIGRRGFLDIGRRMIVERVKGTDKYLVLEGNRRLTAIKHLMSNPSALAPRVLQSLNSIRALELVVLGTCGLDRDEIVTRLLGMLHLKGQLEWGSMERAFYVYRAYIFELRKRWEFETPFYDVECSRECGATFEMGPHEVRNELATYSVYYQLREQGYSAKEEHYTIINMAVRTQGMNHDYFGLDWDSLQMSPDGLERFNKLCLEEDGPVHNPIDFKQVVKVYKKGSARAMTAIETGEADLEAIVQVVDNSLAKHQFLNELEKIEKRISSLRLVEPAGLEREV